MRNGKLWVRGEGGLARLLFGAVPAHSRYQLTARHARVRPCACRVLTKASKVAEDEARYVAIFYANARTFDILRAVAFYRAAGVVKSLRTCLRTYVPKRSLNDRA